MYSHEFSLLAIHTLDKALLCGNAVERVVGLAHRADVAGEDDGFGLTGWESIFVNLQNWELDSGVIAR